jgi:hypothetical protein
MPLPVISAAQSIPELAISPAPEKSGEGFRESLHQAIETSDAGAAAEASVRGKTSKNREDAEKQQNPKHDERKPAHLEESAPLALAAVAAQPSASGVVSIPSRGNTSLTSLPGTSPRELEASLIAAADNSASLRTEGDSGNAIAIAPGSNTRKFLVDGASARNTNRATEAAVPSQDSVMTSVGVEGMSTTAASPCQNAVIQPAIVNAAYADESVTVAQIERSRAQTSKAALPQISSQPGLLAGSITSDPNSPIGDGSERSQSQRLAANHLSDHRYPEGAATSAEQFQKSLVSSQIPLPLGGAANGDSKAKSIHEAGLADGRAPSPGILDGGTDPRGTAHGVKNRDQAEAGTPATTGIPAGNGGHAQARVMPADGVPAALHELLNGNPTGSTGNASRFDGASETKASVGQQDAATAAPQAATESQLPDGTALPITVNIGRLVQRVQESEINLNVRSADFGNVAIHTAMSRERVSAQISLEHIDLGKAIASEVQALQSKLSQEHGFHASIEVQQRGQSFSGNGGQQQRGWRQEPSDGPGLRPEQTQTTMVPSTVLNDGRLDIRV